MALISIEDIRAVGDFARTYLWDVKFDGGVQGKLPPPVPFNEWFPATSVDEPLANLNATGFNYHIDQYFIPTERSPQYLSMTMFDDANNSLMNWFKFWIRFEIFNNGLGLSTLDKCVKNCYVSRLSPQRKPISMTGYSVFPSGQISTQLNSQSDAIQLTVNFRVVAIQELSGPWSTTLSQLPKGTAALTSATFRSGGDQQS